MTASKEGAALLPCPFCGAVPLDCRHIEYGRWGVMCVCGARSQTASAGHAATDESKIVAYLAGRAAWNRRAVSAPADSPDEGCTPEDARVLRKANHALAQESHELQECLSSLYEQITRFVAVYGEADFETGASLRLLTRLRPEEYRWPFSAAVVLTNTNEPMPPEQSMAGGPIAAAPDAVSAQQERAAFEAWFEAEMGESPAAKNGLYFSYTSKGQIAYRAWSERAARAALKGQP